MQSNYVRVFIISTNKSSPTHSEYIYKYLQLDLLVQDFWTRNSYVFHSHWILRIIRKSYQKLVCFRFQHTIDNKFYPFQWWPIVYCHLTISQATHWIDVYAVLFFLEILYAIHANSTQCQTNVNLRSFTRRRRIFPCILDTQFALSMHTARVARHTRAKQQKKTVSHWFCPSPLLLYCSIISIYRGKSWMQRQVYRVAFHIRSHMCELVFNIAFLSAWQGQHRALYIKKRAEQGRTRLHTCVLNSTESASKLLSIARNQNCHFSR